jgi:UDP-2,3-diacylglucosamine pyrophosphatase LpxH
MHHTVVISDIHLCEVEPGTGPWMRYRQRAYIPDAEIACMLDIVRAKVRGDSLTLVLNGDVFDFDAPRVVGSESVFHDLPRSAEHAVPAVAAILDDHPIFVAAIGRVLADGHEVVIISGNHDVQITLPEVRAIVAARFVEAAAAALSDGSSSGPASARATIAARIHFRAWFHMTRDGVLVEHGHLYDPYCSYRYPMAPFKRGKREIVGTMGSIGTRVLVSRLGYFNPHVESSIMMSKLGYLKHWAQYYLFTRRSISLIWAYGTAHVLVALRLNREQSCEARFRGNILACARETGEPAAAISGHARLFTPPAEETFFRVVRELWVDRVAVGLVSFLLGMAWLAYAGMPWGLLGLLAPLMLTLYERVYPKPPIEDTWNRVGGAMRHIASLHKARAVIFGHTHNAEASWEGNVFYGNSGSWSAAFHDETCTKPVFQERPLIWLTSDAHGELFGGLWTWKNGTIERSVVRDRPQVVEEVAAPVSGWQTTAAGAARESSVAVVRDASAGTSQEASG